MDNTQIKPIIEAMLFASGREISINEFMQILNLPKEDIENILQNMKLEFEKDNKGIEIIKVNNSYQLCTKKEYYEYICPLFDNRNAVTLSNAATEALSIIAYNPKITKAEIEAIRGVNSDGLISKLLEYDLIEEARQNRCTRKTKYI